MSYKEQLFRRLKQAHFKQELMVDQPNELCFQSGEKSFHVWHYPEEELSFIELEPANTYVLLKVQLQDSNVNLQYHELHISYAYGEELLRFGVDENGVLFCKRYAGGKRTSPPSIGKITKLLVETLNEQPEYRLHALTQDILYQYYG